MKTPKNDFAMSLSPKKISNRWNKTQVAKFFHDSLNEIYWTEQYLSGMLRRFQMAAVTPILKTIISEHVAETLAHVKRLEAIFELLGKERIPEKNEAITALVTEGDTNVGTTDSRSEARDTAIVMVLKKLDNLEISVYDGLMHSPKPWHLMR